MNCAGTEYNENFGIPGEVLTLMVSVVNFLCKWRLGMGSGKTNAERNSVTSRQLHGVLRPPALP